MTRTLVATMGAVVVSAVMTIGCAGTEPPSPTPAAIETPAAAPDVTVAPLTELAAQFDALEGQQRDAGRRIAELLAQYQKRGGTKQGIIDGRMRLRAVSSPTAQPLDLRGASDIAVDGSAYNLKRITRITLVPEVFVPGLDYAVVVEGPFARVQVLQREKFAVNRFIALVLE